MKGLVFVMACLFGAGTAQADELFVFGRDVQIKDFRTNVAPFTVRRNFVVQQNFVNRYGLIEQRTTQVPVFLPVGQPRRVRISRDGRYQKFDYGKFEVELRVRRDGRIIVDYDD